MKESAVIQTKRRFRLKLSFLRKDMVFTISLILAVASCILHPPKLEYLNFKVLFSLFNLMLAIKALEDLRLLDKFAIAILNKTNNSKTISIILILLCFVCSMFVTNDVALLTFVPLSLVINRKANINVMETVILQTIAANLGSSITPMGNPQNLFIYSYYGIKPIPFFSAVILLAVLGIGLLYVLSQKLPKRQLQVDLTPIQISDGKQAAIWGMVLAVIILSIFGAMNYLIATIISMAATLIFNAKLLKEIDYLLLVTFICFFIFIGNVSSIHAVQTIAVSGLRDSTFVYFSSIFLSQFISNVPASILLAKFTTDWKPLLLGVNIGGLGTIIASLASVISYKLYLQENPGEIKKYLIKFSIYNFSFLGVLTLLLYFFIEYA